MACSHGNDCRLSSALYEATAISTVDRVSTNVYQSTGRIWQVCGQNQKLAVIETGAALQCEKSQLLRFIICTFAVVLYPIQPNAN